MLEVARQGVLTDSPESARRLLKRDPVWVGGGVNGQLGLSEVPAADDVLALFARGGLFRGVSFAPGFCPADVTGYWFTFSTPASLGFPDPPRKWWQRRTEQNTSDALWAVGRAALPAMGWLVSECMFTRRGPNGVAQLDVEGVVGLAFPPRRNDDRQRFQAQFLVSSRAPDRSPGSGWGPLDTRPWHEDGGVEAASERFMNELFVQGLAAPRDVVGQDY